MRKITRPFLYLLLLVNTKAIAQVQPILTLETGMHISTSKKIATDAEGKYLLSCSDDKTARLWDANNGNLLKIFRIPVTGKTGKLFACSMSPDGKNAAIGGETDYEKKGSYSVYIMNTQTAEIKYNIKGLPETINDLEFSPDGKLLAAGLWGENGIYIYETATWTLKKKLPGYTGTVYSMSFNSRGNEFASVSFDGMLRVYDKDLNLINETDCNADNEPISVAYNESGTLLAIGYNKSIYPEVRDAKTLAVLYDPSIDRMGMFGQIRKLCFSKTGDLLFGAGNHFEYTLYGGNDNIRTWNKNGQGEYIDKPVFINSINDIKPLTKNRIALAGGFPELAVLNDTGAIIWRNVAIKIDLDPGESYFKIDQSGNEIGLEPLSKNPFIFNVLKRSVSSSLPKYLEAPARSKGGTIVTNARGNIGDPSIDGVQLMYIFGRYERSLCTDISSKGQAVCFGTNTALHLVSKEGKQLWKTVIAEGILAVNISGNDKLIAATFSDGTIRWYSMKDGKELLALFLDANMKRWVLFTPGGYYDASPGAEDLLGFILDNGPDKAPVFSPVSGSKETYFRPDIINKVFKTAE